MVRGISSAVDGASEQDRESLSTTINANPMLIMGWVEGIVTDLRTGEPMEATVRANGQPYFITTDPQTGYYKLWLDQGTYSIEVSETAYISQTVEVEIIAQQGTTQNFALLLDAPWLQSSPDSVEATLQAGDVITRALTITNIGSKALSYIGLLSVSDDFSGESGLWDIRGDAYRDVTNEYVVLTRPDTHQ